MTPSPADLRAVSAPWTVVCLCAEWCGVCRDYRGVFQQLAQRDGSAAWHWLDIEDHADTAGDVDVETFPCLLIAQGPRVRFLGPLLPHAAVLERLLHTLRAEPAPAGSAANSAADALWARIQAASSTEIGGSGLRKPLLAE